MQLPIVRSLVLLPLLALTGCEEVRVLDGFTEIRYEEGVREIIWTLYAFFGAVIAYKALRILDRKRGDDGPVIDLAAFTAVALGIAWITSGVLTERVVMTESEVYSVRGLFVRRKAETLSIPDVERVTFLWKHEDDASGENDAIWVLHRRDGTEEYLDPGDLWGHGMSAIGDHLDARGCRFGPDPRLNGRPSDDPFVITSFGKELRLDADDPIERLGAILYFRAERFECATSDQPLLSALSGGDGLAGTWTWTLRDGARSVRLDFTFHGDGRFTHSAERSSGTSPTTLADYEGTWSTEDGWTTLQIEGKQIAFGSEDGFHRIEAKG
ncbi:MAG: hypothetical protein AAGG01_11735 [Planctomycetota bacterium]